MEEMLLYMVEVSISTESKIESCGMSFGEKQWLLSNYGHPMFVFNESELNGLKNLVIKYNYRKSDKIAFVRFNWLFHNTIGGFYYD